MGNPTLEVVKAKRKRKRMVREVEAVLANDTRGIFQRGRVPIRDTGDNDVEIDIVWAGICHSDYHNVKGEWPGSSIYPMVPGHEVAGLVAAIGKNVTKFKVGQKVGVGCFVDSCRNCEQCAAGDENYCDKGCTMTYNANISPEVQKAKGYPTNTTYGGYSQKMVVDQEYVVNIPEGLPMECTAPLLCAGITMYSPLKYYGAKAGASKFHVGIVGLGGLGDMGVKLSKAMGNKVTVISTSERKREYAEKTLGVNFICTGRDPKTLGEVSGNNASTFDLILCTSSALSSVVPYLTMVKTNGTFCMLGIPSNELSFHAFHIVGRRKKVVGSCIGGIKETQEVLNFCAENKLWSEVEQIKASEVNRAYTELGTGKSAKQRYVIDVKNTLVSDGDWTVDTATVKDCPKHTVCASNKIIGADNTAGKTYDPSKDKFE